MRTIQLCAKAALGCLAAATLSPALGNCWSDPTVSRQLGHLAQQGFPNAARQLPDVFVCEAEHFGPGIGGDYTSGLHRIRVPAWQLGRPALQAVLAHELAHAEVALSVGPAVGSHTRHFFLALLRAGHHAEANRVAQYVPGGREELLAARSALDAGQPPQPPHGGVVTRWIEHCETMPMATRFQTPDGRVWIRRSLHTQCRWVPQ